MKSIFSITVPILLLLAGNVKAGDMACSGKISLLMAEHTSCKDENNKKQFAFKIEGTSSWKCSGSDTASSLLLAAKISDKPLTFYISDINGATCSVHSNYLKSNYIILSS